MSTMTEGRWNHNIHYHEIVLDALPPGARAVLDVGCGEGLLTRQLRAWVPRVVGVDPHGPSLELARQQDPRGEIEYVQADFLDHEFPPASFDLVASVATLHHLDPAAALARMCELLRPGGRLVVIGLARSRLPTDLPRELLAAVAHRLHLLTKPYWQHPSPTVWPPPHTYAEIHRLAARVLPGTRFR